MNGLDRIIDGILADAREESEKITAQAQAQADGIIKSANEKAHIILENAKAQAETEYSRMVKSAKSAAEVTEKRLMLNERQAIIEDVIKAAYEKILKLDDKSYSSLMERLLNKCASGEPGELVLSERDKTRMNESFIKAAQAKGLTLSDKTRPLDSGFVLVYGDIEENCSVAAIMESDSEMLYDAVNSFLF